MGVTFKHKIHRLILTKRLVCNLNNIIRHNAAEKYFFLQRKGEPKFIKDVPESLLSSSLKLRRVTFQSKETFKGL